MADFIETTSNNLQTTPPSRTVPFREDCWTEDQTVTLVDAWGRRFLELNRGNLRQKDWQEVADAVNAAHGHSKKTRRTDVQCKNRIDTLKKKYKVEKTKILESNNVLASSWPFFERLEFLIGSNFAKNQNRMMSGSVSGTPTQTRTHMYPYGAVVGTATTPMMSLPAPPNPPLAVPLGYRRFPQQEGSAVVTPVVLPQKRAVPDESYFRRNYSQMAAAAAADDDDEDEVEEEEEVVGTDGDEDGGSEEDMRGVEVGEDGVKMLAKAIERFGDIYEKVEEMKQKQMIELEKQRMQFAKELEVQRMQLFMDTQVQLEKMKKPRRSAGSSDDVYS